MLTTITEKVRSLGKRYPVFAALGVLAAFLTLTAAATGITAQQVQTAAPAATGAVNLASTTGIEGTSQALMRADAVLGVKGVLPIANGGTGNTTGAVNLQATTPGSADTGNFNISNIGVAGAAFRTPNFQNTAGTGWVGAFDSTNGTWSGFSPAQPNTVAQPMWMWDTGTVSSLANDNTGIYLWKVNGTIFMNVNRNGRISLSPNNVSSTGGVVGGGADGVQMRSLNASWAALTLDTPGVACSPTNTKMFIVRNNGVEKFSVQCDGVVNTTGSISGTMSKVGSGTLSLGAFSIAGSACQYHGTTLTVTGAVTTDYCSPVYVGGWGTTAATLHCEVTAANTVSFRFCNNTTAAVGIPTAASYVAYVMR